MNDLYIHQDESGEEIFVSAERASKVSIGKYLRELRKRRGWSLSELAKESGISRSYLYELEAGRRSNPTQNVLQSLSDVLGADLTNLVEGKEPEKDNIPESLRQFAEKEGLGPAEIRMLAGIQYRGSHPETEEQWRILYRVIQATLEE